MMSSLYKHLRIHQIFGANTDVGKTILTTALVRASARRGKNVFYLKPVSTGPLQDADDLHVDRHTSKLKPLVRSECLFRYDEPVSPHLAVQMHNSESAQIPSDEIFVNSITHRIRTYAQNLTTSGHSMYVETAGGEKPYYLCDGRRELTDSSIRIGVHSPSLAGTPQADCYRPLFLPTILIGDSKLGGISSTIASYESLLIRGYIIDAVILFRDNYYRNWEYLKKYFEERGIFLAAVIAPPTRLPKPSENFVATENYYHDIVSADNDNGVLNIVDHLDVCHVRRLHELKSLPRRSLEHFWWPFVQHGLVKGEKDVTVIDSAYSDFFSVTNKEVLDDSSSHNSILSPQFDGSASWWTQTVGHAHPSLTLAAARASGRYGHVIFPQAVHLPALKLAERLIQNGPGKGWASRAFISDNGSTGMEVAIKMALRAFTVRQDPDLLPNTGSKQVLGVLGLKGSYHGDTIGAMDACEEGVYTCEWHNAKGFWFDPPSIGIKDGEVFITIPSVLAGRAHPQTIKMPSLSWTYDIDSRLNTPLAKAYALYVTRTLESLNQRGLKLAALILEPLVMGAGGMIFVDPLFQRVLVDTIRGRRSGTSSQWSGLPVIFDEVFVGLNRIGMKSTGSLLGVHPDISVNAKVLTGGLVPLAVTLASSSIFEAFLSDKKADALLHGHSYTAHPIGCEVANETFSLIDKLTLSDDWTSAQASWANSDGSKGKVWSLWSPDFIQAISKLAQVKETMTLGSVLSIKIKDNSAGYTSHSAQAVMQALNLCVSQTDSLNLTAAPGGAPFGVHFRTLGDVAYFMTSLNTTSSVIRSVEDRIWKVLHT